MLVASAALVFALVHPSSFSEGCSFREVTRIGPFVRNQVRPLLKDGEVQTILWGTIDYYSGHEKDKYTPTKSKDVMIDLVTGSIEEISNHDMLQNKEEFVLPKPITLVDPSGGGFHVQQIDDEEGNKSMMATLTSPDGTSSVMFRLDERPDGSIMNATNAITGDNFNHDDFWGLGKGGLFAFYSEKLNLVYVFYQKEQTWRGFHVIVVIFDVIKNNSMTTTIVEKERVTATDVPYAYATPSSLIGSVYDDVQILQLPGFGSDCVLDIFLYYNETNVLLVGGTSAGTSYGAGNVIDSISYTTNVATAGEVAASTATYFKVSALFNDDSTQCDDTDCDSTRMARETIIQENFVSDPNGPPLRQITLNQTDINALFEGSSSAVGAVGCTTTNPPCLLVLLTTISASITAFEVCSSIL